MDKSIAAMSGHDRLLLRFRKCFPDRSRRVLKNIFEKLKTPENQNSSTANSQVSSTTDLTLNDSYVNFIRFKKSIHAFLVPKDTKFSQQELQIIFNSLNSSTHDGRLLLTQFMTGLRQVS